MKIAERKGYRLDSRVRGQALVETAVGTVILGMAFVLMVAFGLNAFTLAVYGQKLQSVANSSVQVMDDNVLWLGVPRPDKDEIAPHARKRAEVLGRRVAQILGIPGEVQFSFEEEETEEGSINKVTASIGFIKLPFGGGLFPVGVPLSAVGASAHALIQPYATINIGAPISKNGNRVVSDGATLPVYGFTRNLNPSAGPDAPIVAVPSSGGNLPMPSNRLANPRGFRGLPLSTTEEIGSGFPGGRWFQQAVKSPVFGAKSYVDVAER
jgi:hypothetical protein